MTDLPAPEAVPNDLAYWQNEYVQHLERRLQASCQYVQTLARSQVRAHARSFLTLLQEAHRYPQLTQESLEFIALLHPLPLRWGLGYLWEPEIRFALEHTPPNAASQRRDYACDLADVHLFRGQFESAVQLAEAVLADEAPADVQAARAVRILFTCYRSTGQPDLADILISKAGQAFSAQLPARDVPAGQAAAWLRFNQCQLELLRERGQVDQALALVEDMIWLEQSLASRDQILTAELLTHRSTLLWVRARYDEAVRDLEEAITLYQQEDDQFNAESLRSNLGLVFWTMGELAQAEHSLRAAIRYYRSTASEQLATYDIGNLGLVHFARGELDEALRLTEEHIQHARRINFISELHRGLRNLGTMLYYRGDYYKAIEALSTSHAYYEKRGSRDAYGLDVVWLALCEAGLGRREQALTQVQEILAWSRERGSVVLEQVTLRSLAFLLPRDQQEAYLLRSLQLAQISNRRLEQAAVQLALGAACEGTDRGQSYWESGVRLLEEIGAQKWLQDRGQENPPFIPLLL